MFPSRLWGDAGQDGKREARRTVFGYGRALSAQAAAASGVRLGEAGLRPATVESARDVSAASRAYHGYREDEHEEQEEEGRVDEDRQWDRKDDREHQQQQDDRDDL